MQYFSTPVQTPAIHRTTEVQTAVTLCIVHEDVCVKIKGRQLCVAQTRLLSSVVCLFAHVGLIVSIVSLARSFGDPALSPPAGRPAGFGERLLVRVLFGMNLVVQKIGRQLIAVIDFNLRRTKNELFRQASFHQ